LSATVIDDGGGTHRAAVRIKWKKAVDCGHVPPGLGFAVALRCFAARPMVKEILHAGECVVGVATLAAFLKNVGVLTASKTETLLKNAPTETRPIARLLSDIYHSKFLPTAPAGLRTPEDLRKRWANLRFVYRLMQDVRDLPKVLAHADVSQVSLDIANIAGLKPCVQLLADAAAS
jgi:hypothetical protein